MSKVSFFGGVHVSGDEKDAADGSKAVAGSFERSLQFYDRAKVSIGPVEVKRVEEGDDYPLLALHAYGYVTVANWPGRDDSTAEATIDSHVQALREALEAYRTKHSILDRHLELVDCRSGGHRILALHYADYSRGGNCNAQLLPERGERLHTGSSTDWNFVRFYKETSPQAREAIDELFRGWEEPPRWFFLAGVVNAPPSRGESEEEMKKKATKKKTSEKQKTPEEIRHNCLRCAGADDVSHTPGCAGSEEDRQRALDYYSRAGERS